MANRFILNETSYHGKGAIAEIVTEVKARGLQKALIVTDADLVRFQVVKKVTDLLDEAGLPYDIYDGVKANPSVAVVQAGVEAYKKAGADYMIAIGGGSPQDTSKGIGIIINNPEFADVVSLEGVAPPKTRVSPSSPWLPPPAPRLRPPSTTLSPTRRSAVSSFASTPTISRWWPSLIPT